MDKSLIWGGLNIQKGGLCVKEDYLPKVSGLFGGLPKGRRPPGQAVRPYGQNAVEHTL